MTFIRAITIDHGKPNHVALARIPAPIAQPSEALVQVAAISVNPGDFGTAAAGKQGAPIGWDLAGTVIQQATDGSGPPTGSRVVGMVVTGGWSAEAPGKGAWAEQVAVPTTHLAALPDAVSFRQAAALPIAGLTALLALEKGGSLWQRSVLITGASGGVGTFAVQIAHRAGAYVVGTVRTAQRAAFVLANGANKVSVGDTIVDAEQFGPYHLIVDSVGGATLAAALTMLAPNGCCVTIGAAGTLDVPFNPLRMFQAGGASLYALALFHELRLRPPALDLARLAQGVADGTLNPQIEIERPWEEIEDVAERLMRRAFSGKAVLHIQ